ncbi:MAG: nucleotidyltransferase [Nitrososphaera sp.]|nr:nucleotidyltransferase [Nitrososphaera sp.]
MNSDFKDLLKLFNDYHVRYLVIGGYAVIQYTEPRYTKDLDVWVSTERENARAVFEALREFGAPLAGMTEEDFTQEGHVYQLGVAPVRIDILMSVTGLTFEEAWGNRVEVDFEGILVMFISKQDLITIKLATGRPQDLIDVKKLSPTSKTDPSTRGKSRPARRGRKKK